MIEIGGTFVVKKQQKVIKLKRAKVLSVLFFLCIVQLSAQDTLSVMSYNLLNFPAAGAANREDTLRKIIQYNQPDVLMVCELQSSSGADLILNDALNVFGTTKYQQANFQSNQSTPSNSLQGMLFYNSEKLTLYSQDVILTNLRDINEYVLYYNSPTLALHNDTVFIDFYVAHLKATNGSAEATDRWQQVKAFKDYIDTKPADRNRIFAGDFNVYNSSEPSYTALVDSGTYKMIDPINQSGSWSNNSSYAAIHTQSPRTVSFGSGASGGLDDRFDFIMISEQIDDELDSVSYISNTYHALGNDGNHFNQSILNGTNTSVPDSVLNALYYMSDHLPVSMQLKVDVNLSSVVVTNPVVLGGATDLIISEYVEGSSNNKYIELYNGTGAAIDLQDYQVQKHTNGGSGGTSTATLSGSLADGSTYIIANSSSNTTILNASDMTSVIASYNGDDVVELQKDNGSGTFVIIDAIGENTGSDPGNGWDVAGVTNATGEHTLIRKSTICSPNNSWTTSAGTNTTDSEWIVNNQDDFTDIGTHTQDCTIPTVNFVSIASHQSEPTSTSTVLLPVEMQDYNSPVDLSVTITGGSADVADYMLNTTTLSFTATGLQNISIDLNPDADFINETIEITIAETTATGITIINGTHTLTVIDNSCSITNVNATALACNVNDAEFVVSWTETNTGGTIEVDINGNGYQTMSSGGTYTITGPTTAVNNAIVTVRDANDNSCQNTSTVNIPACIYTLPVAFINEFHYDDSGIDDGEFVEIAIESSFSGDLSDFKILLYNGNGGAEYQTETADDLTVVSTSNGLTFYTWNSPSSGIQNGNDGIAISYQGELLEFISYEGAFTATDDDANGITATDVGVSESSSGAAGISLQRIGSCTGTCPNGLSWIGPSTESPGFINTNQLPVELISFTATPNQKSIDLVWKTATEENNAFFVVESSVNGINFEEIAIIEGSGTTYDVQTYNYTDESPVNGINYYRLRQVDFDGGFEYHKVIAAVLNGEAIDVLVVPTEVNHQFDIVFGEILNTRCQMDIFSVNGQLLKSEIIHTNSNRQTINVANFKAGLYILCLNMNNTIVTKRFIKL